VSVIEVRLAREVDALRAPKLEAHHTNCGHAMLLTTIALVATSTHSFLATVLAIALVALLPDSDLDTAETP
jgi:hypothetical protein